jgi:hypothetical protein
MDYGSSFGTFVKLGRKVVHGPTVYMSCTISFVRMEIDSTRLSPYNLEVQGIHPYHTPLSDRWYNICARA